MLLEKKILSFGPFRLDPADRKLWRGSELVELKPKVFDTLYFLVSNPGRVLSKEEIIRAIWPDRFVSDANLMQNVFLLRRALGESETGTKYIANFHGRGYQFLVPVDSHDPVPAAQPPSESPAQLPTVALRPPRRLWIFAAAVALAAVCALIWLTRAPRQAPAGMIRRIPLTRLPGAEYEPVVSRDGSKIAFVWRPQGGGATSLFVLRADSDEPRRLWPDSADCSSPVWSPDGRYLAYLRQDGTRLQVMIRPEEGGEPRLVTELFPSRYGLSGRRLDWSPDGRWLAVDDKLADQPFGIYLIDLTTGRRTLATKPTRNTIGAMYPRFSPDGKSIAFVLLGSWFQHDLQVTNLATGATRTLTDRRRQISDHEWSPDGKSVYVAINENGEYRIWKAPVEEWGSPARLQPTAMAGPVSIQFSISRADGQTVASELTQDLNIWRLDLHPSAWGQAVDPGGGINRRRLASSDQS